jgi:hypothetical protein
MGNGATLPVLSSLADIQKEARDLGSSRRSPFGLPIPRVALPVNVFGFVATPAAYGTQVQILQFKVRANWFFLATGIVLGFNGSGQAPGPGDVSYTIDIDRVLGASSGYVEKNYSNVPYPLGSLQTGPQWPVEFRHRNLEVIRIKGTPVANMGLGAANFLTAVLSGWEWPEGGYEGS